MSSRFLIRVTNIVDGRDNRGRRQQREDPTPHDSSFGTDDDDYDRMLPPRWLDGHGAASGGGFGVIVFRGGTDGRVCTRLPIQDSPVGVRKLLMFELAASVWRHPPSPPRTPSERAAGRWPAPSGGVLVVRRGLFWHERRDAGHLLLGEAATSAVASLGASGGALAFSLVSSLSSPEASKRAQLLPPGSSFETAGARRPTVTKRCPR